MHETDGQIAIRAERLSYSYGSSPLVISDLNLKLHKTQTVALSGPNGAGKSTLGKLFTGILKPSSGRVEIFGRDIKTMALYEIGQKIGYVFQNPERQLFAATVEEEVGFGLIYRNVSKEEVSLVTEELLDIFQLDDVRYSFPMNLSYGEKRRVALAAALALSPCYLILDEPTVGLDGRRIEALNGMLRTLRNKNIGMMLISHNDDFLRQNSNRMLVMEKGRIIHDKSC